MFISAVQQSDSFYTHTHMCVCFPGGSVVKNVAARAGNSSLIPGSGRSPWKWGRRIWPPTPVFLPRKFHGPRSLADYSQSMGLQKSQTQFSSV